MKYLLPITLILAVGIAIWFSMWEVPSKPEISSESSLVGEISPENTSTNPSELSAEEASQGFRTMKDGNRRVTLIGHPNSRSWLELPDAIPDTPHEASKSEFVGPQTCAECHREAYEGFLETAHAKTSSPATPETVIGSFAEGQNTMSTISPDLEFRVRQEGDRLFQEVHLMGLKREFPFDIVTGSGKTAQTYLFWEGDRLYQLHLSYFKSLASWINSPGYHDGTAWYTRETIPKCVQCHMTYMEWKPGSVNQFAKESTIFGVSCERCHGPGQKHVAFHRENPQEKAAKFIKNPNKLERERTNDVCSQCHLGTAQPLQAPFSFRPGDKLEDHFEVFEEENTKGQVHTSNQLQRMELSQCFLQSEELTCVSCHNPHRNEHGNTKLFSARCIKCHEPEHCGLQEQVGPSITENCIDCHMGMGYDDHIQIQRDSDIHMPLLRDHFIRVLPEATRRYLEANK